MVVDAVGQDHDDARPVLNLPNRFLVKKTYKQTKPNQSGTNVSRSLGTDVGRSEDARERVEALGHFEGLVGVDVARSSIAVESVDVQDQRHGPRVRLPLERLNPARPSL